jgi:hypothetical protein
MSRIKSRFTFSNSARTYSACGVVKKNSKDNLAELNPDSTLSKS